MDRKLKPGEVLLEVVAGVEGPSIYVSNDSGGHRLSGPKPWGGGRTVHKFVVKLDELLREAPKYASQPAQQGAGE